MKTGTCTSVALSFVALTSALTFSGANAQTPANKPQAASVELQEVTVTGSRVIANGNDSPTPVTVVTIEDIQATRPTTVFEGLLDMPQFAGSRGAATNPGGAGANNNNISALSLRGLGQGRTLILFDGHRVASSQANGYVNANSVPQMLLQRVDVVTGGVSAVYGSDGITGVVNFITDRKFNGVKVNLQYGVSDYHDDRSREFGIAGGMSLFGGRGHLEGSYQTHDDAGVLQRSARQFGRERWTLQGAGSAVRPYFLVPYARIGNTTFGGRINGPANNPLVNQQFVGVGVLGPFTNGSTDGVTGTIQLGGDGAWFSSSSLKSQLDFHQVFGRFDFDFTDNLHFYLTGAGMLEHSFNYNTNNQLSNVTISATNGFLTPAYQTAMTSRGITSFTFSKIWDLGSVPPTGADDFTRQWSVNTGLEGKLGAYHWDISLMHSQARMDNRQNGAIDNGHLYAALDAVVNPANGQVVCQVSLTANAGLYPGCVPINVFGSGAESRQAIDYIIRRAQYQPRTSTDDIAGSFAGAPFNDWAGPVNMALSGEWRHLDYELLTNSLPAAFDPLSCTGLRFNCVQGTSSKVSSSTINRPPVSQTVSEAAIEAAIPLLKDMPLTQLVELNAAYRYARYSQTGSPIFTQPNTTRVFGANTWKVGLTWHLNDALTLRATRSRDFRAPNLNDLYAPGSLTVSNLLDTLTNTVPSALTQSGGNPNLQPETSYTTTVGLVLKASEQVSFAVDAYDIKVGNALGAANGQPPQSQAQCYASGGTSFYCTLQERPVPIAVAIAAANASATGLAPAAYAATKWYNLQVNAAVQEAMGIDLEANYRTQLLSHPFSLRGLLTYQPHSTEQLPGAILFDYAAVDFANNNQAGAVWRASVFARFSPTDRFTLDWLTRYRSNLHHNADPTVVVGNGDPNRIPAVMYSNLNLGYKLDRSALGQADLYMNVQNLFNQQPYSTANSGPQFQPGNFGGPPPGDDVIGRYYSVGIRYRY